jgi:hypothetical protein
MGGFMKITFTDINNPKGVLRKPKPASEYIPVWYKKFWWQRKEYK